MTVQSPSADGNKAFDKDLELNIPFATHSDALLASLALTHEIDPETMDLLFALLRDPTFSPAEVTLGTANDIYLRVAEHRRELVASLKHDRADMSPQNQSEVLSSVSHTDTTESTAFPWHIILHDLVDILEHERTAKFELLCSASVLDDIDDKASTLNSDLQSLSLVQRSWTQLARRAIGRVIWIPDMEPTTLAYALQEPLVGPWTRKISIMDIACMEFRDDRPLPLKTTDLFACLLRCVPNLQSLRIAATSFLLEKDLKAVFPALASSELRSLRELHILNKNNGDGFTGNILSLLSCLCKVVPRFPELVNITLSGWSQSSKDEDWDNPATYPVLPESATELERSIWSAIKFSSCADKGISVSLSLVKRPESTHGWAWECFHFENESKCIAKPALVHVIAPYLSDLRTVHVSFLTDDSEGVHAVTAFLAGCTNVRSLFLEIDFQTTPTTVSSHFMDVLPDTVKDITISCQTAVGDAMEWDMTCSQFVASHGNLCRLSLDVWARPANKRYIRRINHWPQTTTICQERNIVFK